MHKASYSKQGTEQHFFIGSPNPPSPCGWCVSPSRCGSRLSPQSSHSSVLRVFPCSRPLLTDLQMHSVSCKVSFPGGTSRQMGFHPPASLPGSKYAHINLSAPRAEAGREGTFTLCKPPPVSSPNRELSMCLSNVASFFQEPEQTPSQRKTLEQPCSSFRGAPRLEKGKREREGWSLPLYLNVVRALGQEAVCSAHVPLSFPLISPALACRLTPEL